MIGRAAAPRADQAVSKEELKAQLAKILKKPSAESGELDREAVDGSAALATIARYNSRVRNPMTAIRAKCIECSGGSPTEVARCTITSCALHLFRMGKNPFHSRSKLRQEVEEESDD